MIKLASIFSFAFAVVFYVWSLGRFPWTWELFMLIGFLCAAIAGRWES